ncbi:protein TonB [Granulicella rosea]|uniref:Protein TonB n=1 Tax=Granulicella rosea TaxID=474952 RepID=A0A239LT68_9BACT|nr:energy transducer TonB [Granulicella rosea]SNT32899.1 protein TonB [Granulicella rosea]
MFLSRRSAPGVLLACMLSLHGTAQETSSPVTGSAPTDSAKVERIGGGVTPPKVVSQPEPEFSKEARKKKIAGNTTLTLVVDPQGLPTKIRVVKSAAEGYKKQKDRDAAQTLDAKAIEAVEHYRFTPAMKGGQPVSVQLNIVVNFQIF